MHHSAIFASAGLAVALAASTFAMAAGGTTEQQLEIAEPILAPWTGPYGGVPPFDKVKVDAIGPALEVGMARKLAEIELIATNPEPPTFDNTIAALERAGRTLSRARTIYDVYTSTMSHDAVQAVERVSPASTITTRSRRRASTSSSWLRRPFSGRPSSRPPSRPASMCSWKSRWPWTAPGSGW